MHASAERLLEALDVECLFSFCSRFLLLIDCFGPGKLHSKVLWSGGHAVVQGGLGDKQKHA